MALIGDLIADLAVSNGWEGVIIHGVVRDAVALSKIDLGIKALDSNPCKSHTEGAGDKDMEISFSEVIFTPGCHVYSDADGVFVAREYASYFPVPPQAMGRHLASNLRCAAGSGRREGGVYV